MTGSPDARPASTWVFDVDASLVDSFSGASLRPGARQILRALHEASCRILLWSAGGADYARRRAAEHGLSHLVHGFFAKEGRDEHGRYRVAGLPCDLGDTVFVDDCPEDLPSDVEIVRVSPYIAPHEHDRGLTPVAARAGIVLD